MASDQGISHTHSTSAITIAHHTVPSNHIYQTIQNRNHRTLQTLQREGNRRMTLKCNSLAFVCFIYGQCLCSFISHKHYITSDVDSSQPQFSQCNANNVWPSLYIWPFRHSSTNNVLFLANFGAGNYVVYLNAHSSCNRLPHQTSSGYVGCDEPMANIRSHIIHTAIVQSFNTSECSNA